MDVFDGIVGRDAAIPRARRDHRDLALERDQRFEDERHAAHRRIGAGSVAAGRRPEHALALAVIAEPPRLQHAGAVERAKRRGEVVVIVHSEIAGCGYPGIVEEALFGEPVLGDFQRPRRRIDRDRCGKPFGSGDRHVLELVGDDGSGARQFVERGRIVIGGDDLPVGDLRCRAIRLRLQDDGAVAEAGGGHRQHAAELSAADDADRRAGGEPAHSVSEGCSATAAVCLARHWSRRCASAASDSASTEAASSAALMAPALPIASVPTGMPAGICTIE